MYRNILIGSVAAIALLNGPVPTAEARQAHLALFAIDFSTSASAVVDPGSATSVGNFVESYIRKMKPGDMVKIRTLGIAGVAAQQIYINVTLGRKPKSRPRRIAPIIGNLFRSLPRLVKSGKIKLQPRTNIIGFIEAISPSLDCKNTPTKIVIFSDGIEWSTQVRGDELLSGKRGLPAPSGAILRGCDVEMRGLGQQNKKVGTDSRWFPLLRTQWTKFFTAAGVSRFAAYAEFE